MTTSMRNYIAGARLVLGLFGAVALLANGSSAFAGVSPEQKCLKGRHDAAAKYATCHKKVLAKRQSSDQTDHRAFAKCRTKYAQTWDKLQAKATGSGSTCDQARFEDNGDGTLTDWLTELQWEKKSVLFDLHFVGATTQWSTSSDGDPADADGGFIFATDSFNTTSCLAGQCSWRMPTLAELQTILLPGLECAANPCIDPVFGPTTADFYWSATTDVDDAANAWHVDFSTFSSASIVAEPWPKTALFYFRAVQGGL